MSRTIVCLVAAALMLASATACGGSSGVPTSPSPLPSAAQMTPLWRVSLDDGNLGRGRMIGLRTGQLDIVATVDPGSSSKSVSLAISGFKYDSSQGARTASPSPAPAFSWQVTRLGKSEKHFQVPAGQWLIGVSINPGFSATVVVGETR